MSSRFSMCTRHAGFVHVYSEAQKQVNRCRAIRRRSKGAVTAQITTAMGNSTTELITTNAQKITDPIWRIAAAYLPCRTTRREIVTKFRDGDRPDRATA